MSRGPTERFAAVCSTVHFAPLVANIIFDLIIYLLTSWTINQPDIWSWTLVYLVTCPFGKSGHYFYTFLPGYLSIWAHVYPDTCLSVHLCTWALVYLDTRLPGHLSICTIVYMDSCQSGHLSTWTFFYQETCLPGHLSIWTFVYMDTCQSGTLSRWQFWLDLAGIGCSRQ